jgi:hypothetical protein
MACRASVPGVYIYDLFAVRLMSQSLPLPVWRLNPTYTGGLLAAVDGGSLFGSYIYIDFVRCLDSYKIVTKGLILNHAGIAVFYRPEIPASTLMVSEVGTYPQWREDGIIWMHRAENKLEQVSTD